jgi:hypothetical protein
LEDSAGKLLAERVQVFGRADLPGPFAGLLRNHATAPDSTPQEVADGPPNGPDNLAFVGNGAKPATASSALPNAKHQPQGLNDGKYGNDHSWIGMEPRSWFQIDLGKVATVGQFKLGRDRTAMMSDRQVDYLKIETSPDGVAWQPVFEQSGLTARKGYSPGKSLLVSVAPVQARLVKVTVDSPKAAQGEMACVDEFEVYAPAKGSLVGQPQVRFIGARSKVYAVRRTALQVTAAPVHKEGAQEVLELQVKNTSRMTALFCEPHPLLVYRTDLFIDNNNCFIPPGESRVITIRASCHPECGLSLAQTGWTLSTWNADDVTVAPSAGVMLSVGRWDKLCREYAGYFDVKQVKDSAETLCSGPRDNASKLPYRMWDSSVARFDFECNGAQAKRPARLRIHTSDQAETSPTVVEITVNGRTMEKTLRAGLGIQRTDPAHLAFPDTIECQLSGSDLRKGMNVLSVRVKGDGWFSWDALDLVSKP